MQQAEPEPDKGSGRECSGSAVKQACKATFEEAEALVRDLAGLPACPIGATHVEPEKKLPGVRGDMPSGGAPEGAPPGVVLTGNQGANTLQQWEEQEPSGFGMAAVESGQGAKKLCPPDNSRVDDDGVDDLPRGKAFGFKPAGGGTDFGGQQSPAAVPRHLVSHHDILVKGECRGKAAQLEEECMGKQESLVAADALGAIEP